MSEPGGIIEVDLFPSHVDDPDHPEAARFRETLEAVGEEYSCELTYFEVDHGTVSFSFDDERLMAEIIRTLKNEDQDES